MHQVIGSSPRQAWLYHTWRWVRVNDMIEDDGSDDDDDDG
jgi:hypothetical protein